MVKTGYNSRPDDRDVAMRGDNGWSRDGSRSQEWNSNSFGAGSSRDYPRSSYSRGSNSRGRFADGARGFRGRGQPQGQGQIARRYSGSETHARPAGSRSPRADSFGTRDTYTSEFGATRGSERDSLRNMGRSATNSRPRDYSYPSGSGDIRGFRDSYYAPPSAPGSFTDGYYSHPPPPPGVRDDYYGFPLESLPYPPMPPDIDPYGPRGDFYPSMPLPPPGPSPFPPYDWRRDEFHPNNYEYPPSSSRHYEGYNYDAELPGADQQWRTPDERRELGRFRDLGSHGGPPERLESDRKPWLRERSPNRASESFVNFPSSTSRIMACWAFC